MNECKIHIFPNQYFLNVIVFIYLHVLFAFLFSKHPKSTKAIMIPSMINSTWMDRGSLTISFTSVPKPCPWGTAVGNRPDASPY